MTHSEKICTKCSLTEYLDLKFAARELVEAVEQYVEPKPGQPYMHRMRLLNINNKLKHYCDDAENTIKTL